MTTRRELIQESYKKIEGELYHLPNKRWRTYSQYAKDFDFIKNSNILRQVSKYRMTFDYFVSLYELHKPLGPIQEIHFLSLCHMLGSICEAMLKDLFYIKIAEVKLEDSYVTFDSLLKRLGKILSDEDKSYLNLIKKIKNSIHIDTETEYIKYFQTAGHLKIENVKDDFLGRIIEKREFKIDKLIKEFDRFCSKFHKYY